MQETLISHSSPRVFIYFMLHKTEIFAFFFNFKEKPESAKTTSFGKTQIGCGCG